MKRRSFLRYSGLGISAGMVPLGITAGSLQIGNTAFNLESKHVEDGEVDWDTVRMEFSPSKAFINLENGYFSPQTAKGYASFSDYGNVLNQKTSFIMRTKLEEEQELTRIALAEAWECNPEELVVTRNTTEALNNVIMGYPFKRGDEAVIADLDYPNMVQAFEQREKRDGIVLKRVKIPLNPNSDEELISLYSNAISTGTKVILLTHMINYTGHLLPVRKIADMAHQRGVEVIVDAAHSFAHIDFKMYDLGADYLGTSLHKWLSAPLGTGLLYIKKNHISKIWPLMGDSEADENNIRKFERQGTIPLGTRQGIRDAIKFHKSIGGKAKEERLRSISSMWIEGIEGLNRVTLNTPEDKKRRGAIGNISIKEMKPMEVSKRLFKEFGIFTVPIEKTFFSGVRITPHLYNSESDIQNFIAAIKSIAA